MASLSINLEGWTMNSKLKCLILQLIKEPLESGYKSTSISISHLKWAGAILNCVLTPSIQWAIKSDWQFNANYCRASAHPSETVKLLNGATCTPPSHLCHESMHVVYNVATVREASINGWIFKVGKLEKWRELLERKDRMGRQEIIFKGKDCSASEWKLPAYMQYPRSC